MSVKAQDLSNYSNEDIVQVIDSYVHNKRHREILKARYIDGICYEPLAEMNGLSVRQTKNIVYKYESVMLKHINKQKKKE